MKSKKLLVAFIFILSGIFLAFIAACRQVPEPSAEPSNTAAVIAQVTPTQTRRPTASPTLSPTPTLTPTKTRIGTLPVPTRTFTPIPTRTSTSHVPGYEIVPQATPVYAGTAIPSNTRQPITLDNLPTLNIAAHWGRGSILGAAFTPDGEQVVVGSTHGIAVYRVDNLDEPPAWIAFDPPYTYDSLYFSADGQYLLLVRGHTEQVREFSTGKFAKPDFEREWLRTTTLTEHWGEITAESPDGQYRFEGSTIYDEEHWDYEYSIREIFASETDELLFELPDRTIQIEYTDFNKPLGCDLVSFSYCGNVYSPNAAHPYRVGFAPDNRTLAVLYRPPNLSNTARFSLLRIYQMGDGKLLSMIGSKLDPVRTFAYSPDGKLLVAGFGDGRVQIWDMTSQSILFSNRHFSSSVTDLEYSTDGAFIIIQRPGAVEVRRSSDGALLSRLEAAVVALSPNDNILALGQLDGSLRLVNFETGQTRFSIQAHAAEILSLAFSPDGSRITSSGLDCEVKNWDAISGEFQHKFEENRTDAYQEGFTESRIFIYGMKYLSGTNQLIGVGSWARVVNWNTNSGATRYLIEPAALEYYQGMVTLNPYFPEYISVDPENQVFYVDQARYALETGELLGQYQPPATLPDACLASGPTSPDGELHFTIGYNYRTGQICVLNVDKTRLLATIEVLEPRVAKWVELEWLYLSPDGSQLVVTTTSDILYVYEVQP